MTGVQTCALPILESTLDHIAGVVTNGLFSRRGADVLLVGRDGGVDTLDPRQA